MLNYFDTDISLVQKEHRFNPKYFNFLKERDLIISNSNFNFVKLGNKEYYPTLSDGIHSSVTIEKEGNIKYLYVHSLKEGFIDITDNVFLSPIDHLKNKNKQLKCNDVLLSVVGTLGNTAIFSDYVDCDCSLPRNIAYIRTNPDKILPEYLVCFFLSKFSKKQCAYSGGGNIQGLLSLSKLKKFNIPVFETDLQEHFANQYNKAIKLQKEFLIQINHCKSNFFDILDIDFNKIKKTKAFNIDISNLKKEKIWNPSLHSPYPYEILKLIRKKYNLKSLAEVATIKKGNEIGRANYNDYLSKSNNSIPFVRTSDIFNYEIDSYPDFYANQSIFVELNQDFIEGDIVFNNDGKIGFISIITNEDKAIYQSHIKRIRPKKKSGLSPYYIFLSLITPQIGQIQFDKYTVIQSTIPTLANRIEKVLIPIIDNHNMNKISKEVKDAFKLIEKKKKLMREIKENMNNLLKINS